MSRSAPGPAEPSVQRTGTRGRARTSSKPATARRLALLLHRYVGLVIATFLVVAGLTGSVIAFYTELDAVLNPDLFRPEPPAPGAAMLDPFTLLERYKQQEPRARTYQVVYFHRPERHAVEYWVDEEQAFLDPYTGKLLGSRTWGTLSEGRRGLLPFLYRLHFSLALGDVGTVLFGVVALLWTLDCFVGAYLTFPLPPRKPPRRPWLARWLPSLLLNASKLFSLIFSWHRASGLWLWGMLLVFGWSAVALNLGDAVYLPVMNSVLGAAPDEPEPQALAEPRLAPRIAARDAQGVGRRLMAEQAEQQGFQVIREMYLDYHPELGLYEYGVESTRDLSTRLAETHVRFDADSGTLHSLYTPTGVHTNRTLTSWLVALHFGAVRGLGTPYRALVCAVGVLVALLSASGVWIWWKKSRGRGLRT